jgi:hypothetical protein
MHRVKEIEEGDPLMNAGGFGGVPPPKGDGNGSSPPLQKDPRLTNSSLS